MKELGLTDQQIHEAIERARKGVGQYLELMQLFPDTDVATDLEFRRKYRAFYRVRRGDDWAKDYFGFMESQKGKTTTFKEALEHLFTQQRRVEASFASKLVATHDPHLPVWDRWVLKNQGMKPPAAGSKTKIEDAVSAYEQMIKWYQGYLASEEGARVVSAFDRMIPKSQSITNLKKVDFVLWQIRDR